MGTYKIDISRFEQSLSLEVAIEQGKLLDKVFRVKDIDIDYLIDLIVQEQVTCFTCVPSILRVFLQHPKLKDCHCLKQL